ncbi:MAG: phage tail tape measure protein [Syntrophomonadaceae bacterium]|nr:phage tail tape measure protein [Syntrophomonadaceae bacterium]
MAIEIGNMVAKVSMDQTGFQQGISKLNRELKVVQSEFRASSAQLGDFGKSTEGLKLKANSLTKQLDLQKQRVQALEGAYKKSVETKGADAKATQNLEIQLNKAREQMARTENTLKSVTAEIEKQSNKWHQLSTGLQEAGTKLKGMGGKLADVGKNLSMKITAPLAALGGMAVKTGIDFEAAMSEVGAISGATGEELAALAAKAKELGATTKFSASEAAEGLKYMVMAGWDTQQQLAGLPGVLNLAAASGEDLGRVSDIVTDAMTAFGMEAARAGEFADTLAAAASSSNTNVGMLGESFKYVAPVAGALGYSVKDASIALGLMANAGIKGTQSGTALRATLTRLVKPPREAADALNSLGISIKNSDGSMKSLSEVMGSVRAAFANLTPDQQAFYAAQIAGQEAMSGLLAIVNTSEQDYNKLSDAINGSADAANRMAKEMQDNLHGRLVELKSALEGVAIQLYDVMQLVLENIVASLQNLVAWFANLSPAMQKNIVIIAGLAAAIGPLLMMIGQMAIGIAAITTVVGKAALAFSAAGGAAGILGGALTVLTGPIGIAITAITAVVAAGVLLYKHWDTIKEKAV